MPLPSCCVPTGLGSTYSAHIAHKTHTMRIRSKFREFHAHTFAYSALFVKIITKIWFSAHFTKPITYPLITLASSSTSLHMRCMRRIGKLRIRCAYTPFFRNHAHTLACSALLAKIITKIWFSAHFPKPITYTLITVANSSTSLHMRCMCGIGQLRIRCAYTLFYRNHAHTFACSALLVKIITKIWF